MGSKWETKLDSERRKSPYNIIRIMNRCPSLQHWIFFFFLGWGIWLPSNKNIAPVLFYYNWLSAEWCNSLPKSYFSSFECAHCVCFVWSALDDTRWINAIFLSFSSASILSVDPFKLSIPFLPLSSPVSFFFHEQEGFTLLLCHPNWLH